MPKKFYKCSYAYDVPHYADFIVEAESEHEAETIIEKALADDKFAGVSGDSKDSMDDNHRVFVSGELEEGEQTFDPTLEEITKS